MENTVKYDNIFDYFSTESFKSNLATFFFGRNADKKLDVTLPPEVSQSGDVPMQDIAVADTVTETVTVNEVTDVQFQDIAVIDTVEQTITVSVQEDNVQEVIKGGKVYKVKNGDDDTDLKLDQETLTEAAKRLKAKFSS